MKSKILLLYFILAASIQAQEVDDYLDLSLEELMNIKVTTASYQSSNWRQQPGIITIFTSKDIQTMGAQTLRDVLLNIPGVSLGMDNNNAVSLIFRGSWTLEGKILYVINDMPVNDLIFGTYTISPYYPAEIIDRLEVLRGPGSAKYGGNGQIAVIRIYTKQKSQDAQITFSGLSQSTKVNTGILTYNDKFQLGSASFAISGGLNNGKWGTGTWTDANGKAVDVSESKVSGENLAINADLKNTHYKLYYENYDMSANQGFGINIPGEIVRFLHLNQTIYQDMTLDGNWTLQPKISFRNESTWRSEDKNSGDTSDIRAQRAEAGIEATNNYSEGSSITIGLSDEVQRGYIVKVFSGGIDNSHLLSAPTGEVYYNLAAMYASWNFNFYDFDIVIGCRAIYHSYAHESLTPRIGITKSAKDWHVKWLLGTAFREPNIEQIDNNKSFFPEIPDIKPEQTTVTELEYGHVIGANSYITSTVFYQYVQNPIIYTPHGFTNNVPSNVYGAEFQYLFNNSWLKLQANYSRTYANNDDIPLYDVYDKSGQYVGAAANIANVWTSLNFGIPELSLQIGARYLGQRAAMAFNPSMLSDSAVLSGAKLPISQQDLLSELTFNVGICYESNDFTVSLSVQNLTDTKQLIPQPYNDISTPFPYGSRELRFKIKWKDPIRSKF